MLMLMFGLMLVSIGLAELAQVHPGQLLHGDARSLAAIQHLGQEHLHVRADPVEQLRVAHLAHIRRAQRVAVRRGAGWQQHVGAAGAILDGGGDQLQRLDAGQHADLGAGGQAQEQGTACDQQGGRAQGHGGTHR
ncbi:hypothetical protein D9M68_842580 [compost metagenome]